MLNKIRAHNEELLRWFRNEQNQHAVHRQMLIKDILSDDACFLKMTLEEALAILRDLGIPQSEAITVYTTLTNPRAYSENRKKPIVKHGTRPASENA